MSAAKPAPPAPEGGSGSALLTPKQASLLDELAGALNAEPAPAVLEGDETASLEAFHQYWGLVKQKQKRVEASQRRARWRWIFKVQEICEATCQELEQLLGYLDELDTQRLDVLRKTTALHEQCEQMVHDQEELSASAETLAERLDLFDRVADVARVLDHQAATGMFTSTSSSSVASTSSSSTAVPTLQHSQSGLDFSVVLEQLDESIAFLEAHPDFIQSQASLHQFEHLRNRACLAVRSALQRSLEKSSTQVEQQLREKLAEGTVPTEIFYAKFKSAASNFKSLMSLLHRRVDVHESYAVTLEELEAYFANLRMRLVSPSLTSHLQSILHKDLQMKELAPATRRASAYMLDITRFERQCFEAYFDIRQPQEALRMLLDGVTDIFYQTMRPVILSCDSIDSLREIAVCLQMDILEPNQQQSRSGELVPFLAVVFRLHKDVQEKLIFRVETYIRDSIKGYQVSRGDLDYPDLLLAIPAEPAEGSAPLGFESQQGWYPTLRRTLGILGKIYNVLELSTFQGLAQEAVELCIVSLKNASQLLMRRALPESSQALNLLVLMMDSQLFLLKHLLVLREQVAAFECDLVVSEKYFNFSNFWDALHLKLPDGLLGILKPKLSQAQVDSKKVLELELKAACEGLITNLMAQITQPLLNFNTQADFFTSRGSDRAKLREQPFMQPAELKTMSEAFLANVRELVPFAAAHVRLYLSGGSDRASGNQSTAPILFKPVQIRLVDTWSRMEGLLEEQHFTPEDFDKVGFVKPEALRELVASLFNSIHEAPWDHVAAIVRKVPRAATPLQPQITSEASAPVRAPRPPAPAAPEPDLEAAPPPPPPPPPPPEPRSTEVAAEVEGALALV